MSVCLSDFYFCNFDSVRYFIVYATALGDFIYMFTQLINFSFEQ